MEVDMKELMTRRRFIAALGRSAALATLPAVGWSVSARGDKPKNFGGPTPNRDFYVTSYSVTPQVSIKSWRLKIGGLVSHPIELTYSDIGQMPSVTEMLTLECISNPPDGDAISNAVWVGPKLRPLLDKARVSSKAVYAALRGADGYYTGVPVEELMRGENFLPYLMNGSPLPPDHGYPLRLFIPGKYGMKQPKWLTGIEFVDREFIGYWETRGWSNSAWRKVNSGFFDPRPSRGIFSFAAPTIQLKVPADVVGWALAGSKGVRRVEVSADDGKTWHEADLLQNASPYVWTVWRYHLASVPPGGHVIRVRATDGGGIIQPVNDPQTGSGMSGQPQMKLIVVAA
jgi:DMSO/TMAO reductase YedYZ molybdopterin-dependent catalytic subunit